MGFKVDDSALTRLGSLPAAFHGGLQQGKHVAGQHLVRTSQRGQSSGSKSGRVYGSHQASAPGEYSAPRTWSQHNSISYEVTADGFRFGAGQPYSVYLELGTSKMAPRPDLGNAVDESGDEIARIIGETTFRRIVGGG